MNVSNPLSASELIYLFIDGEADGAQRTSLLSQLAHDGDLQQEFQDALKMRTAVQAVAQNTVPSAALTSQLFARAGFGGSTVVPVSAWRTAAVALFQSPVARSVMIGIGAGIAGSLITASVLRQPSVAQNLTPVMTQPVAMQSPANTSATNNAGFTAATSIATNRNSSGHSAAATHVRTMAGIAAIDSSRDSHAPVSSAPTAVIAAPSTPVISSLAAPSSGTSFMPVSTVAPFVELRDRPGTERSISDADRAISVTVRGLASMQQLPIRTTDVHDGKDIATNIGVGIAYRLSEHQTLGLEAGGEQFPLYLQNDDGVFERHEALFWMGASYRYTFDAIHALGGIAPFGQVLGGGTIAGPIAKSIVGVEWQFDPRVSMSLGAEGTLLMHNLNGVWSGAQKLGVTYGFAVKF